MARDAALGPKRGGGKTEVRIVGKSEVSNWASSAGWGLSRVAEALLSLDWVGREMKRWIMMACF